MCCDTGRKVDGEAAEASAGMLPYPELLSREMALLSLLCPETVRQVDWYSRLCYGYIVRQKLVALCRDYLGRLEPHVPGSIPNPPKCGPKSSQAATAVPVRGSDG
jgi:hypothetical protein